MKLDDEMKCHLVSELDFIIQKIETETDVKRKVFFQSAAHGAIERAMRYNTDGELYINHFTLNLCYNTVSGVLGRIAGGDTAVLVPEDLWSKINSYLRELRTAIDKEASTYPTLEKIAKLTYSLTGPGHYSVSYLKAQETTET